MIIDNASDAFGGDENNRVHVRGFMRMLADIARETGAAVLLLAHIDKASAKYGALGNSYSGSTAWHNSARSRLALTEKDGAIEMVQEKLTIGRKADPLRLGWDDTGVLVPDGGAGAALAQGITDQADDNALRACFAAAAEAGVSVPAATTGPATTWHVLSDYPELPPQLKGNKSRFKAGIARLLRAGAIRSEDYRDHHRSPRVRLVLCEGASVRQFAAVQNCNSTAANPHHPAAVNAAGGMGGNCRTPNAEIELPHPTPEAPGTDADEDRVCAPPPSSPVPGPMGSVSRSTRPTPSSCVAILPPVPGCCPRSANTRSPWWRSSPAPAPTGQPSRWR